MRRRTQQRRAIRRALAEADRPLAPREILAAATSRAPSLGIATVYRNLKSLLEEGWLRPVELPGEPARYELSDKAHHHHFHCRECDRVFEVDDCPDGVVELAPRGFHLESHEIVLYGLCRSCALQG
jgi:Fur family ferric uptake transcriptional regulator